MKKPEEPEAKPETQSSSRRNFLQMGALAAGAATIDPRKLVTEEAPEEAPEENQGEAALVPLTYDLNKFVDPGIKADPIVEGEDVEITAVDFTQGLTAAINSIGTMDENIRADLLDGVQTLETAVVDGDETFAIEAAHTLRDLIECYSFHIDISITAVGYSESTSFSQILIVLVDFLIRIRARIIGVIFVFPAPLVFKIVEIVRTIRVCLTIIQIQQLEIYIRFWLFILTIRFSFGWLGLRISIDFFLIFISICLRVTIVNVYRICLIQVRRQLLLVQC